MVKNDHSYVNRALNMNMFEKSDHTFQLPVRISNITLDFTLATYHDVDHCKVNIVHARFERISKTKKKEFCN